MERELTLVRWGSFFKNACGKHNVYSNTNRAASGRPVRAGRPAGAAAGAGTPAGGSVDAVPPRPRLRRPTRPSRPKRGAGIGITAPVGAGKYQPKEKQIMKK